MAKVAKVKKPDFLAIHREAHAAGAEAAKKCQPNAMVVTTEFGSAPQKSWYVPDGVCGFAWVEFPGNTAWGRWTKEAKVARPHYPKGLCIWVSDYNQSMQRKEAYARGYAEVLRQHGINCHAGSRMD